nr:YoaK family protein [uncultured Dorea sp.]
MGVWERLFTGKQMSEAFICSAFLALSGGFQDAYTYNTRNEVFSNAQTGNVVLMSQNFMTGKWVAGLKYLFPLFAFALGVLIAEQIQNRYKYAKRIHWRQGILGAEIIILFIVGFIPQQGNMLATVLVSFACAMQVQSFRKVNGFSYASTMCIGNLRSGTAALSFYLRERRPEQLRQAMYYFGIIFLFAIGAGIGGNLSAHYGIRMIWVSCGLLIVSFLLMFMDIEAQKKETLTRS